MYTYIHMCIHRLYDTILYYINYTMLCYTM